MIFKWVIVNRCMTNIYQLETDLNSHRITPVEFAKTILDQVKKAGSIYAYIDKRPELKAKLDNIDLPARHQLHLKYHNIARTRSCLSCGTVFEKYPKDPRSAPIVTCSKRCTNIYRYGATTPFARSEVQAKKLKTVQERYACDNVFKAISVKTKIKNTLTERYGGVASSSPIIAEKIKNTNLKRYGVPYAIAANSTRATIARTFDQIYGAHPLTLKETQDKCKSTRIVRYGSANPADADGAREQALKTKRKRVLADLETRMLEQGFKLTKLDPDHVFINSGSGKVQLTHVSCGFSFETTSSCFHARTSCRGCGISKPQREIFDMLISAGETVIINDRKQLNGLELDLWLPEKKLAIEVNGIYWHRDVDAPNLSHRLKTDRCNQLEIDLLHVFDFEWDHRRDQVKSIIFNKLGKSTRIAARKLQLRELSSLEARSFFEKNHLSGHLNASLYLGLVDNTGKIVQGISIGRSRYTRKNRESLELYRFATLMNHVVIGGFEKLISEVKRRQLLPLISYVDRRYFTGSSYKRVGFVLDGVTPSNYWYVKDGKILNRLATQKHKLPDLLQDKFDPSLTETENMQRAGYFKFTDSGNYRMILL